MMGSTNTRNAFAFATVVTMRLCMIKEEAIFDSIAARCEAVLPK
jgi:hypothetical protein